jgi:hypothetical protein
MVVSERDGEMKEALDITLCGGSANRSCASPTCHKVCDYQDACLWIAPVYLHLLISVLSVLVINSEV